MFAEKMNRNKLQFAGIFVLLIIAEFFLAYLWRTDNRAKIDLTNTEISCYHYKRDWYRLQFFSSDGSRKYISKSFKDCETKLGEITKKTLTANYLLNSNIIYSLEADGKVFHAEGKDRFSFYWWAFFIWAVLYAPLCKKYAKPN